MRPFEKFSDEINKIAELHPTSRLVRIACRFEYWRRRYWSNETFHFKWVADEGTPIGEPIEVIHMTLHDMMEHQAQGILTSRILLEGLRVNAIQRLGFVRLDKWNGKTTIQPRWV